MRTGHGSTTTMTGWVRFANGKEPHALLLLRCVVLVLGVGCWVWVLGLLVCVEKIRGREGVG